MFLKKRSLQKELMDEQILTHDEAFEIYKLLRRLNRCLFGRVGILKHIKQYAKSWDKEKVVRILDIAGGAGDTGEVIINWARKNGHQVQVVTLDLSLQALYYTQSEYADYSEMSLLQANCFQLPFKENSFDYVISSLFFHHLTDNEVHQLLIQMNTLAKRGIVVNDLVRKARAYLWIKFFSLFTQNIFFRTDGPRSVRKAFTINEIEKLVRTTGLDYLNIHPHFGHRFAIAGEK